MRMALLMPILFKIMLEFLTFNMELHVMCLSHLDVICSSSFFCWQSCLIHTFDFIYCLFVLTHMIIYLHFYKQETHTQ
jgi:hypothetical protein